MGIKIGVDIDGTVTRPDNFLPFINIRFKTNLKYEMVRDYDLSKYVPVKLEEFSSWFKENEALFYESALVADGVKGVLTKLKKESELHYVSARDKRFLDVTLKWLLNSNIPFDTVNLLGTHRKVDEVKRRGLDLFIEDHYGTAVSIAKECKIPVLLLNTPYNQGKTVENLVRVYSWLDIYRWVNFRWKAGERKSLFKKFVG